jgi:hypothetical protein
MNKDFLKMQKLAGLITEGQYKEKINEGEPDFTYHDPELSNPDNPNGFKWKEKPARPNEMLTMYDSSDDETGETFTKQSYWESDIIGRDPWDIIPDYVTKEGETWNFGYHDGSDISGFVEGEDFTFGR